MASLLLRKTLRFNQLRTFHRSTVALNAPVTFNTYAYKQKFHEVLPEVMETLMASPKFAQQLPEVRSWVTQLLQYTLEGGKQGKGMTVGFAYEKLEDPKYFTEENLQSARFLGWSIEMMLASLLIADDVMDDSTIRRGKPCWHLQPNVGTSAINDCLLIHHCSMEMIELKFGKESFYSDLVKLISEALMYTTIGQYLDYSLVYNKEKNNLDTFTMERLNAIVIQKSGYFSFRFPLLAGLLLVKNEKERDTKELTSISFDLAKVLQIQNDYKDIYWDESSSGKIGTDIQEGKLSWMAVTALERCNEAQRSVFKEYYGSKDPEHVKRIKQLYDELQMDKVYKNYTNSEYERLEHRIRALPTEGETEVFLEIMKASRLLTY